MGTMHNKLGATLRKLRELRGITQSELAEKAGFTITYISLIESGKRNPTAQALHKIADVLDAEIIAVSRNLKKDILKTLTNAVG